MQQQARGFAPGRTQLALYLHGPPGIGKSQLVTLLATSLQTLLRGFFAPGMAVQVVKLPLNSLTVAALHSISIVRGISDMSVERMIEQHLTKGNVVRPHALPPGSPTTTRVRTFRTFVSQSERVKRGAASSLPPLTSVSTRETGGATSGGVPGGARFARGVVGGRAAYTGVGQIALRLPHGQYHYCGDIQPLSRAGTNLKPQ
jgi:hypothetical protein